MQCKEAQQRLLDLLEQGAGARDAQPAEAHLAACGQCRDEYELLRRGREAVLAAAEQLAPEDAYLTPQRLQELAEAPGPRRRWPRIIRLERLVAAAAAAAILVSTLSIYMHLRSPREGAQDATGSESASASSMTGRTGPVMEAYTMVPDQGQPRVVTAQMMLAPRAAAVAPAEGLWRGELVRTSSPGLYVPVRNPLYDFEESAWWW